MDTIAEIKRLKRERNAVILVHNYQLPEIHDIADFIGDSLGLSIEAAKTKAEVIVFCGVYFMAETAKILSPQKTVIIPDRNAGCPMADMITAEQLRALKAKHPKAKVLCYVNTPAEVKAECDLCCTSANAVKVVKTALLNEPEVIFAPDKYLASYVSSQLNKEFIVWPGYCPSHVKILAEDVAARKKEHPKAVVLVHPECNPEVIALADQALSTEGIASFVKKSSAEEFIIGTEPGMIYRLKKENPDKLFWPASELAVCANMKRTTLDKVYQALVGLQFKVEVSPEIIARAQKSINRMIEISR